MLLKVSELQNDYKTKNRWRWLREWAFRVGTLGLGSFGLEASVVRKGQLGLRCDRQGKITVLPPGRYYKFPWENYPIEPRAIHSDKIEIDLMFFKVITVKPNHVAGIFQDGNLTVKGPGQYVLDCSQQNMSYFRNVFVGEKAKRFHGFTAYTSDNVVLNIHPGEVRFQITHPDKILLNGINKKIEDTIQSSICNVVKKMQIAAFLPMTGESKEPQNEGSESHIVDSLRDAAGIELSKIGVKLLSINPTWTDKNRLIKTQHNTQRRKLSAEGKAQAAQAAANQLRQDPVAYNLYIARNGNNSLPFFALPPQSIPAGPTSDVVQERRLTGSTG